MAKSSSKSSKDDQGQLTDVSNQCKICGDAARGLFYSVLSCPSCKTFFKRNAEQKQKILKCNYDSHCEVNIYTRHICAYCRLRKCFSSGMQVEMIRCSRSKPNTTNRKRKTTENPMPIASKALVRLNQSEQFPTLNLLEADHSTLSIDQWNLISSLSHCFDIYSGLKRAEIYVQEQNTLPVKLRYRPLSLIAFLQTLLNGTELIYQNNQDFLSLSSHDRSILLHSTVRHTTAFSSNFIEHQIGLTNDDTFLSTVELITHPEILSATKRLHNRLNFDMITMKLFLVILSFSTTSLIFYSSNTPSVNLSDIAQVLDIQNKYIELAWRYLVYKYSFKSAVIYFSDFIQCLFALHDILVKAQDIEWYTRKIDSIVDQTEQALNLKS